MTGLIVPSKTPNFSGEISPSSLTTSEKSDIAGNVTANTSGESDPGYESDGTKKLMRLQNKIENSQSENGEITLTSSNKTNKHQNDSSLHRMNTMATLEMENSLPNIINVENNYSDVSANSMHSTRNKNSFSARPIVIKHSSSTTGSSTTNTEEMFNNGKSQGKNSTYSNSKIGNTKTK